MNKLTKGTFSEVEKTIASNFFSRQETVLPKGFTTPAQVRLQNWDMAGSEQFKSLTPIYYKGVQAVCLVYDSTKAESLEGLDFWVKELDE